MSRAQDPTGRALAALVCRPNVHTMGPSHSPGSCHTSSSRSTYAASQQFRTQGLAAVAESLWHPRCCVPRRAEVRRAWITHEQMGSSISIPCCNVCDICSQTRLSLENKHDAWSTVHDGWTRPMDGIFELGFRSTQEKGLLRFVCSI